MAGKLHGTDQTASQCGHRNPGPESDPVVDPRGCRAALRSSRIGPRQHALDEHCKAQPALFDRSQLHSCGMVTAICALLLLGSHAGAEQPGHRGGEPSSIEPSSDQKDRDRATTPSAEERLWSHLRDIPIGPFKLDLGASLRLRGELQHNFNVKTYGNDSHDELLLERLRVEVGLHFLDGFRLFVQGQDAHELGCNLANDDFQTGSPYNNHFDLRQAFLEWRGIGGTPMGFKLGRQSIAFTDNRLMGPGEWGNVGRYVWDAAVLTWRSDLVDIDLFYAFRVQYNPVGFDDQHFDDDVLGFFSSLPIKMLKLHAFYFLKMNNFPSGADPIPAGSFHRHSPGVSLDATFENGIDLGLGVIPQFGRWGDKTVSALGGYAVFGYSAPIFAKPRVGIHYAYGSGDSKVDDKTIRTFDGIFGAVDKYYGRMNLLAWMNLHDAQIQLSASPLKVIKIVADYHLFVLAESSDAWYFANSKPARHDNTGNSGRIIGHEVDVVLSVNATRRAQIQAGFGLFVPGAFVRNTGSHDLAHWGFLQASYGF